MDLMDKKLLHIPRLQIFPSILSADFGKLAEEAKRAQDAGADGLHIDVMDGHFAQNLTLGPRAVGAIRRSTNLFLDIHLMIYNPFEYIERFVEAGANSITFHFEATENIKDTLTYIHRCNVKAGLAISPETPAEILEKFISLCDVILVMTVKPGFGGQKFMSKMTEKIKYFRKTIDQLGLPINLQVDGGIDETAGKVCVKAGANVLVSGSYLYAAKTLDDGIKKLRGIC